MGPAIAAESESKKTQNTNYFCRPDAPTAHIKPHAERMQESAAYQENEKDFLFSCMMEIYTRYFTWAHDALVFLYSELLVYILILETHACTNCSQLLQ